MKRILRSDFNTPPYKSIVELIKKNHVVAKHTQKNLKENRGIPNFCELATHYMKMGDIFLHYEVGTWFEKGMYLVKIDALVIYDNFMEYESTRLKTLHSSKDSDIPNIN